MKTKKKALGRGLSAILESPDTDITSSDISGKYVVGAIANIPLENIESNPFQPRDSSQGELLEELSRSIREQGVIQPITVRKLGYDKYQLISGERRCKAALMAGLKEIPAYIRIASDQQMLEMALVENIQRDDLNPLDVAGAYQRLIEECNLTQEVLSERVGKNRTTITNYIRLLKLPAEIQLALKKNMITMGHARALLSVDKTESQVFHMKIIIEKELSVREIEKIIRDMQSLDIGKTKKPRRKLPVRYQNIKDDLVEKFGTNIDLKRNTKGKGSIVISFESDEDLERIISIL
jgi:ParB family chromosome partitioning protein